MDRGTWQFHGVAKTGTSRLPLSLSDSSLNSFSRRLWFLPSRISCPFAALHLGKPLGNSHSPLTSRPLASLSLPCTWPFTCSPLFLEFLSPLFLSLVTTRCLSRLGVIAIASPTPPRLCPRIWPCHGSYKLMRTLAYLLVTCPNRALSGPECDIYPSLPCP